MRHSDQRVCSSLAGYVWKLKDEGRDFEVKWKILQQHTTYNPTNNSCRLCLSEKFTIMFQPELATLNQRDEFYMRCMQKMKKLLDKTRFSFWSGNCDALPCFHLCDHHLFV